MLDENVRELEPKRDAVPFRLSARHRSGIDARPRHARCRGRCRGPREGGRRCAASEDAVRARHSRTPDSAGRRPANRPPTPTRRPTVRATRRLRCAHRSRMSRQRSNTIDGMRTEDRCRRLFPARDRRPDVRTRARPREARRRNRGRRRCRAFRSEPAAPFRDETRARTVGLFRQLDRSGCRHQALVGYFDEAIAPCGDATRTTSSGG